ncbi:MAG: lactate utilization protein C [Eggerthellaceae bacterium]|nr:lactate utilization protein C [Eggerthellaceae bacterium]
MAVGNKTLQDLLGPISKQMGHTAVAENVELPEWEHVPWRCTDGMNQQQLVDKFIEEAGKIGITIVRTPAADIAKAVAGIIQEGVPEAPASCTVVAANDERFAAAGLYDTVSGLGNVSELTVWDNTKGQANVDAAEKATYGITYAVGGIADTATIVQPSGPNCGRTTSLLPLVHIALVDAATIKPIMQDVMKDIEAQGGQLPSSICFISGPSATADIELVRVQGVHGPMYIYYVLVD